MLCDILGEEILEIYNDFAAEGLFTKDFNTENISKGAYFIKIFINENYITKKVIII
jgi:hypothetical protein